MGRLDGRVAVITGGAGGQGKAEAQLFAAEGAQVLLTDVRDVEGESVAADIGEGVAYRHHDVTDEAAWDNTVAVAIRLFGAIDVLVNNAGLYDVRALTETTLADYRRVTDVNQLSVFLGMRAVAEPMRARRRGSIVNVGSVSGLLGTPRTVAYTASKFAVRGMTKAAAKELAPFDVRVNAVHPGFIDTPMLRNAYDEETFERGKALV